MNIISRLNIFQRERFPLRILLFTTLSSILSSAAVCPTRPDYLQMVLAFVVTMLFLYHIRVIDESRDLENDTDLHPERPVQRGVITLKQLFVTDFIGLAFCLALAIYAGVPSLAITLVILAFTTLAWKDFFAKPFFARRPVLYHIVNSPQMVFILWNIYAIYTKSYEINYLMLIQMLLIYNGIFIIEVIRKIKPVVTDTADTYSSSMGVNKAIWFSITMIVSGYLIFALLLNGLEVMTATNLLLGALTSMMATGVMLLHKKQRSVFSEKLMVVGVVIYYVGLNLIIYYSNN